MAVLYVLFSSTQMQDLVAYFWRKNITLTQLLLLQSLLLLMLVILGYFIFPTIAANLQLHFIAIEAKKLYVQHTITATHLFYWSWWITISPIVCHRMTRYLQHLSLPAGVLSTLIFPVIILLVLPEFLRFNFVVSLSLIILIKKIVLLSAMFIMISHFVFSKEYDAIMCEFIYKQNEDKQRVPLKIVKGILVTLTIMLLIYCVTGAWGAVVLLFAVSPICYYALVLLLINYLKTAESENHVQLKFEHRK
jgi:uncharacterized membrane protein